MHFKYRSVRLIDKGEKIYKEHCERIRFLEKSNRIIGEPDYKRSITSWLEIVLVKYLSKTLTPDSRNILTWEELDSYNRYLRKFREIDGFFSIGTEKIFIEVKASLSKSNFNRGKTQIKETLQLLARTSHCVRGILIMADCRCFDPTFGYAKEIIEGKISASESYKTIEGLNFEPIFVKSEKWLWTLSQEDVLKLAELYGPPEDEEYGEYQHI